MQTALETEQSLSLERKLKLHEARESIIGRLAANLPTSINLDSFLKVIVAELGRMMEVDRCDIIKLTPEGELRVSHEWRASEAEFAFGGQFDDVAANDFHHPAQF